MSQRLRFMALLLALTLSQTSTSVSQEPAELKLQKWLQKFAQQNSLTDGQLNAMLGDYVLGSLADEEGWTGNRGSRNVHRP
jgi:hypothetical protein